MPINTNWCFENIVWADLAKFRHFGKNLKVFGKIVTIYLVVVKI